MSSTRSKTRKRTMAEEEAEKQRAPNGCRRSSRPKNLISTKEYRRMKQLFWQDASESSLPLTIGKLKLQQVHHSPNIFVLDGFLSASELQYCDSLIQSQQKFKKSFVDNDEHSTLDEQRTSTFLSLEKMQTASIASIERRAAELLGITVEQIEPLQLVRYRQGEFFGIHHDMGVLYEDGSVELPPRQAWSRRRLATLFVYLNDVPQDCGGCTYFPECNHLRVQPKRGRAVLFCNILENGMPDSRTVHAGEPICASPKNGNNNKVVKYGMNIWACEE